MFQSPTSSRQRVQDRWVIWSQTSMRSLITNGCTLTKPKNFEKLIITRRTRKSKNNIHSDLEPFWVQKSKYGCYFQIFSVIDNRLCINRLIIDNRNFNWPVGSEWMFTVAVKYPTAAAATQSLSGYGAICSAWESLGCSRCCCGKIKQRVPMINCSRLTPPKTNRPASVRQLYGTLSQQTISVV